MPALFGIDIAALIASNMGPGLLPATLRKVTPGTRDPSDLSGGTNPTEQAFACRGIIDEYRESQFDGTLIQRGDRKVLILGGTLPSGVVPEQGDKISIEGQVFQVVGVPSRDPAAATYTCQARKT